MDLIEEIVSWDKSVVWFLNESQTPFWNSIMIFFSHKYMPIPIYILFIVLLLKNYGWKKFLISIIPAIILVILLADGISSKIFKPWIERLRPCYEMLDLNLPNGCGGQFGFFSSHAANSFAVASLIFLLLREQVREIGCLVFLWASIVSFSRIYLSVHYPSDILVGALFGILIGLFGYWISLKIQLKYF